MISIIMGSKSDDHIRQKLTKVLDQFGVEYEVKVISAHRALDSLVEYVRKDHADIYIGMAGKAAHLPGVIAGLTYKPVIGIPVKSSTLDGMDSLLSIVQMPKGVPVATVAIDGGENAGLLALQILGLQDEELKNKLIKFKEEQAKEAVL